jgi:hypothetical protein
MRKGKSLLYICPFSIISSHFPCTVYFLGYKDFDFFDKMEPPRHEIDVKWDSMTHL